MKNKIALKISFIYLLIGFLWILYSDKFLLHFIDDFSIITKIQTYKGWFFVLITSTLLFLLVRNEIIKKNEIEKKLQKARLKAEESDRLKSAFLANMSHEIRTPLNGILGFSELLKDGDYNEETKNEFISQIAKNGNNLLVLINDIIDISRIQENLLDVVPIHFKLNEMMENIYSNYSELTGKQHQKDVNIILKKGSKDNNLTIYSDPIRIGQVMKNLLNNAIKFTHEGHITFGYISKENIVEFFVEDTGIGIPENQLNNIFNRFYQPKSTTIGEPGFGLGLSISKGLVDLLGGQIGVESKKGKGSRFCFSVPKQMEIDN